MQTQMIPLASIDLEAHRCPDTGYLRGTMPSFAANVSQNGLLRPLIVVADGDRFKLIQGYRRFFACKAVGFSAVPCAVVDAPCPDSSEFVLPAPFGKPQN